MTPGLGDKSELSPEIQELFGVTVLRLGDDLGDRQPLFELIRIDEFQFLGGIAGLAAAAFF